MNLIQKQIILCCLFIICIGVITYFHIKNKNNELFTNDIVQFTKSDITDTEIQTLFNTEILKYNNILKKYIKIDPAINANNDGKLCDTNITNTSNNCKVTNNSEPQCLVNESLSSCNNFFIDGIINSFTSIDLTTINNYLHTNIIRNSANIITDINNKKTEIDNILFKIIDKKQLKNQQDNFILINNNDLIDKQHNLNKTTTDFETNENDVFINQYNFKNYLSQNNVNTNKLSLYKSIMYGLIITIIITLIILFFVS